MAEKPNPFIGLRPETHDVIEQLLADIYRQGDEWGDQHEDWLDQWRAARGEDMMGPWRWWVGRPDDEAYSEEADSREKAIEIGLRDYADEGKIRIIEARIWDDVVKEGEDVTPFADRRKAETIEVPANG